MPCINLPLLQGKSGLPVGVQLVSSAFDDERLFRNASWLTSKINKWLNKNNEIKWKDYNCFRHISCWDICNRFGVEYKHWSRRILERTSFLVHNYFLLSFVNLRFLESNKKSIKIWKKFLLKLLDVRWMFTIRIELLNFLKV